MITRLLCQRIFNLYTVSTKAVRRGTGWKGLPVYAYLESQDGTRTRLRVLGESDTHCLRVSEARVLERVDVH